MINNLEIVKKFCEKSKFCYYVNDFWEDEDLDNGLSERDLLDNYIWFFSGSDEEVKAKLYAELEEYLKDVESNSFNEELMKEALSEKHLFDSCEE